MKEWKRLGDRQPFLEPSPLTKGLVGNYDRLQLAAYNGIIQHGDEVRFYYGGIKRRAPQHDRWPDGSKRDPSTLSDSECADWLEDTHSAMCLAVLRRDGFASLDADAEGGMLLTKPFITKGSHLTLNVVVRGGGEARVAVLHANGEPISGLQLEDCDPLRDDSINQAATWNSGADISKLAGQPIRLRFELKDAELYSFQFATRK